MSGRIEFTMGFRTFGVANRLETDRKYRMYILGNFSGHAGVTGDLRKIRKIDIDNFDRVMSEIGPMLEISSSSSLRFETLDDFHPDVWVDHLQILADLQALKRELNNPDTAAQAAAKIQAFLPVETENRRVAQHLEESGESEEDMLERLLGKRPVTPIRGTDMVDRFIEQLVVPHVTKGADLQHQALINVIDTTVGQFVLSQLHRQDFQSLEGLWRATEALVNEEVAGEHDIYLVDVSRGELMAESKEGGKDFEQKLLAHFRSFDDKQDVVLIGDYLFSDTEEDRNLLGFCGRMAEACGGVFLGGADHSLARNTQEWRQYLNEMRSNRIVLAYPRYLLRLPYGAKRNPLESVAVEECSAVPQPNELLWGNPAFLCARAFLRTRQGHDSGDSGFFSDIPAFAFDLDGEQVLQPGTEVVLNEAQANDLVSHGITPLIGFRQRQGVRLLPIANLAEHS